MCNFRLSVWRHFLVEKSGERRYLCSLTSVRRVASESWTAWKACGTGWTQLDPGTLGELSGCGAVLPLPSSLSSNLDTGFFRRTAAEDAFPAIAHCHGFAKNVEILFAVDAVVSG